MSESVQVRAVDDLGGLISAAREEQERRRERLRQEKQRAREEERRQQRADEYFRRRRQEELRSLAQGSADFNQMTATPPAFLSGHEVQQRAQRELQERRSEKRHRDQAIRDFFRSLTAGDLDALASCDHRCVQEFPCGDCDLTSREWSNLLARAPVEKSQLSAGAEEEIERRRRAQQEAATDGGARGRDVAGVDQRTALIALLVAGLVLLGGG